MSHPPRLCFDGALYHVTTRGDNKESVFLEEADYQQYLMLLRRYKDRFHFILHAYALMANHVHLIAEPAVGTTVSQIMQCLTSAYTRYFNHRHGRVGHVFQGRFHSRLIERDVYLLVASRYVHLNPVRANVVRRPALYPWSSYRAYRHPTANPLSLVDPTVVLSLVSPDERRQRDAYCDFVEARREPAPGGHEETAASLAQGIVGSNAFRHNIQARFHLSVRRRGRPPRPTLGKIRV